MLHSHLRREVLGLLAVEAISHKVQHIAAVYLLIRRPVKPAADEVLDGQHAMQLQEALLDFLDSVNIYFFHPLLVHYGVPERRSL